MIIGIIGAGNVGSAIGLGLMRAGHQVVFGVRDPEAYAELAQAGGTLASVPEAVARAEAVILATPWNATEAALAGAGDLGGKPLLDATNPIGAGFALTHGHTDSGGEQVARWARNARVVKVFNTTGFETMANPRFGEARAVMFACSDDEAACAVALGLAQDLGFEALPAGPLRMARLLEPFGLLWINLALVRGHGRGIAFGLLRR
jgi:predicted dinucleotide-binding enzyme